MTTDLHHLIPPSACKDTGRGSAELLRAVMIRSNFTPTTRHQLGWRGVQEIVQPDLSRLAMTAKIRDMAGVYGIELLEKGQSGATFSLCYFPDPEEPLLEYFSLQAGVQAVREDFLARVRQFCLEDPLPDLFAIGRIHIRLDPQTMGRMLSLESAHRIRTIAHDGIFVPTEQGEQCLVRPGGEDQDLPALETAMSFFRVLASSFGYTQKAGPDFLCEHYMAGFETMYDQDKNVVEKPSRECLVTHLTLGFGTPEEPIADVSHNNPCSLVWHQPAPLPEKYAHEPWWQAASTDNPGALHASDQGNGPKPRLIVLTGFLGSGKTSFLDRFIEEQTGANAFVAVVQNEIGEKGLDGKILGNNYAVTEMDEGCVCCTLAGNLRAAVQDILDRFDPDFIVLETTGLANPANLLQEVDDLEDILTFASITTVVDAAGGLLSLRDFEVARSQIRLADTILLNKCDLVGEECLSELMDGIIGLNPTTAVHKTTHGNIRATRLYGINLHKMTPQLTRAHFLPNVNGTHLTDHIGTRLMEFSSPLPTGTLLESFRKIRPDLLRAKGVIELDEEPGPVVFQYSPGVYSIEPAPDDIGPDRFLVFIGQNIQDMDLSGLEN
ncbi:CobW family GTP-binding protein [Desulfoplanes sp.]